MMPTPETKRWRTSPSADPEERGADLISRLPDDVLLLILTLLPDARDAARTDALSRRWRGLWTRVPALRFSYRYQPNFMDPIPNPIDADRYAALVDAFLSRRAAAQQTEPAAAIESLSIVFDASHMRGPEVERVVPSSMVRAAKGWIQYAVQHAVRRFVLDQSGPWNGKDIFFHINSFNDDKATLMDLDDLPSSANLETMHLRITRARIRLPATAVFASLTDLSLESIRIADGSSHLLARFLSSKCCPRLLRLRLQNLRLMELLIEADTLVELTLEELEKGCSLQLRTPSLRILRMTCRGNGRPEMLRISAPRLEELTFEKYDGPDHIIVDGELPFMENLTVYLRTHGLSVDDHYNDVGIRLLQSCTSVSCLELHLDFKFKINHQVVDKISGRIPHLPHVTSLMVRFVSYEMHSFGFGLDEILTQCGSLKHLCIQCCVNKAYNDSKSYSLCDHPNHWQSRMISLTHLQDVELCGLTGTDCDLWFMQLLFASTTKLKKVKVSLDPQWIQIKNMRDAFELNPLIGGGVLTACCDKCCFYEWKPCVSEKHISECDQPES